MKSSNSAEFQGQTYFDDRLYVSYLCKAMIETAPDGMVTTTIYHNEAPSNSIWCLLTYRNCNRYPLFSINHFSKKEDAIAYLQKIEPETPLISLSGGSPQNPLSYEEYLSWKITNNFKDYDWQTLFSVDATNRLERISQTPDQFKGIV